MSELTGNEMLIVATIRDEISAGLTVIREELKATARAEAEVGAAGTVAAAGLDRASSPKYVAGMRAIETANRGVWRSMLTAKTVAGTLAIVLAAVAVAGVTMSAKFDAAMMRVHTQAGASLAEVKSLRSGVLSMAGEVGVGPDQLALSLYHVESAGFRGAQALDLVRYAAEGARIGNANLEDTTQAMIAATASQIKGVHGAADAMGQLNAIVGTGDMKMEQLARAMATGILPSASVAGLSLRDVGAALATITDNATPADEAATRLRMTFALMSAPTDKAIHALGQIGIGSTQLARDMRKPDGLLVAVGDLRSHLQKLPGGIGGVDAARIVEQAFGGGRTSGAILTLITQYDRLQQKYVDLRHANPAQELADSWRATQATTVQQVHRIEASVQALGIRIGDWLMPYVNRGLGGLEHVLQALPHDAAIAWQYLGPIITDDLHQLENVGQLIVGVGHDLAPLGGLFLLAFGAGLKVLGGLAAALVDVTGFLAHHRAIVEILAALYLARLAPGIALVARLYVRLIALRVAEWASQGAAGLRSMVSSLRLIVSPAGLVTLALVGAAAAYDQFRNAQDQAKQKTDDMAKGFDLLNPRSAASQDALNKLNATVASTDRNLSKGGLAWQGFIGTLQVITPFTNNATVNLTALNKKASETYDNLIAQSTAAAGAVDGLALSLGIPLIQNENGPVGQLRVLNDLAAKLNLGPALAAGGQVGAQALGVLKDAYLKLEHGAGMTKAQVDQLFSQGSLDQIEAFQKAVSDAGDATGKAFSGAVDVVANLGKGESLDAYYKRTIRQSTRFTTELETATRRGLDPHMVERLLEAGPAAAGPILDQLVAGHGNRMINLANASERSLAHISEMAVRDAQMTAMAVNAPKDQAEQMAKDLGPAMAVATQKAALGGAATAAALAKALHMKVADVNRIGVEYGIAFATGVTTGAGSVAPPTVMPKVAHLPRGAGDTYTPRGRGLPSRDLGRTMAFHAAISARTPGVQSVSSAQRNWGLGSAWSDHRYGRAADIVGSGLPTYQALARAAGAFAEFHGSGADRHLHVVPSAVGDTAGPRIPPGVSGGGGAGVHIVVSVAPGAVVVQGSNASPAEIEAAAATGVEKGARRAIERARVPASTFGAH